MKGSVVTSATVTTWRRCVSPAWIRPAEASLGLDWFPCRSRTLASPIHRGGTLNGSSRHWMGNVSSSEPGSFSIPNGSLLLSGLGQGPSGRAIRTHDLEQTLRARFGRPLPDVSGTGARGPFPAVAPPITPQLAGRWASPYLGRKGAIPREADWTRGRRRGSSPPPKLADTGEAVWESGERRDAGGP